ncbi:hypothetical protein LCGC14_2702560 [marine sediment metagenome]|uniref:Uncharacterized protein n=1 Tax=marine sediment metagenome TaxID=412755 RepID=A0A0F9BPL9_9ZZZZ
MKIKDLKVGDKVKYQFKGQNERIGIISRINTKTDSSYPFKVTVRNCMTNLPGLLRPIEIIEKIEN